MKNSLLKKINAEMPTNAKKKKLQQGWRAIKVNPPPLINARPQKSRNFLSKNCALKKKPKPGRKAAAEND